MNLLKWRTWQRKYISQFKNFKKYKLCDPSPSLYSNFFSCSNTKSVFEVVKFVLLKLFHLYFSLNIEPWIQISNVVSIFKESNFKKYKGIIITFSFLLSLLKTPQRKRKTSIKLQSKYILGWPRRSPNTIKAYINE